MRPNEKFKSSYFTHHKKETNTETSEYDRVLNALKELYALYNPTMTRMHEPVIKVKYKVTGNTRVVLIVMEHEEYEIQWA